MDSFRFHDMINLSPTIIAAAVPAARIASQAVRGALEASANFASHLVETANRDTTEAVNGARPEDRDPSLNRLLGDLQRFLTSIGANPNSVVELKTDGRQPIEVEGEPQLKQAVESWLSENTQWSQDWQSAVRHHLARSRMANMAGPASFESSPRPQLRTQISLSTADHFESQPRARR